MSTFIALAGYLVPFGLLMLLVEILRLKALEPLALGVFRFFASLSPFGSLGMLASGFSSPFFTMSRIALGQGAFSLLALLVARRMLTQTNEERSFTSYSAPPPLPAMRGKHAPVNFFDDRVLPPWPPVRDHANPMLARELLQMRIGQRMTPLRLMLIAICILPIILVLAYAMNESGFRVRARDAHTVVHAWIIGLTVLMAFVAPGSCAAAWSREYERETMDLLRTALLTPRQLVYGKVIAALRACALPLILAATASLPLIPYPIASGHALIMFATGLVTIGVTTVECVAVATLMGLLSRRTTASILYGYAGSMAAICLPFLINAAIVLVTIFRTRDDFLIPWWHLSPITTYAYQLSPASQLHASSLTIWASCMVAQLLFAGVVLRVSVALVTARHLQDN